MSDPYSVRVGRGDEYVRGRGIQQFDFTDKAQSTRPFTMYIDHGSLSDFIEMGQFVKLYHNQERIFKGRILGVHEDDSGISIAGNDMMVGFPNIFVDAQYPSYQYTNGYGLKKLIRDLVHKTSDKRHVDYIDAETFVRPTNYASWWNINDKPLMTLLNDLVPSSQDPTSYRRNTFFLDPYDNLHVEPIGAGGVFKGAIEVQKKKIGAKVDGSFCNYAVFRGTKAVPDPIQRDSWTEGDSHLQIAGNITWTDDNDCMKNLLSLKGVRTSPYDRIDFRFDLSAGRDWSMTDYAEFYIKMIPAAGVIDMEESFVYLDDDEYFTHLGHFDENVNDITSMSSGEWYKLRIPLPLYEGDPTHVFHVGVTARFTDDGNHTALLDNFWIERSERISTQKNLLSIKTFGMFEKRKRDSTLWYLADVVAAAQRLLNPYPKMDYAITAKGYVPIKLNQTIDVRWKEVDWVLPLTQKKVTLKGKVTNTFLTFGGMPLSADDVTTSLAAETRAEAYGRNVRINKGIGSGDDPYSQESFGADDGIGPIGIPDLPLEWYKGRSANLMALVIDRHMTWEEFNQYGGG